MYALRPDIDSSISLLKAKFAKTPLEKCDHSKKVTFKSRTNCFSCGSHLSSVPLNSFRKPVNFPSRTLKTSPTRPRIFPISFKWMLRPFVMPY